VHGDEYRARAGGLHPGLTLEDLRRQVRELKARKGLDITLKQRLAFLTSEVGEVAEEVLRLSRGGDFGKLDATTTSCGTCSTSRTWTLRAPSRRRL
jgi:hypothetical protein